MGMRKIRCGNGSVGHRTGPEAPGPQGDEPDTGIPRSRDAQVLIPSGKYTLLEESSQEGTENLNERSTSPIHDLCIRGIGTNRINNA